ncbi:MAG: ABC transporter substrate-binding protein [Planctomycetaceae bacterium]|nr:ABC transporter substrate-binding protein [Planctomycetaceae bacterium]
MFVFFLCSGCGQTPENTRTEPPQRIISTLPSITEVLFDIGIGDRIVGDSAFTKYPPEAAAIEKIGGLYDMNREKILSLKPDLMIFSDESTATARTFSVPVLFVNHRTLEGMLESYRIIGQHFGGRIQEQSVKKQKELQNKLDALAAKRKGKKAVRTLISIDRSRGTGRIQNLFAAGSESFLNDVVVLAGGENVAASTGLPVPVLSAEGVIQFAPEVIIDLQISGENTAQNLADWQSLGGKVPAVKNRRFLVLTEDYASIPGPRTPLLVEKIVQYFELSD